MLDFNTAQVQTNMDPIPHGTLAPLQVTIRPGGGDDEGWLKPSKDGRSQGLDVEFVVTGGEFTGRKFWTLLTLSGETEGHQKAARISASRLRAIVESARGVKPSDTSDLATKARCIKSYGDLDGLRFIGKIGLDKGSDGYPPKNTLLGAITPDQKSWLPVAQVSAATPAKPAVAAVAKPAWA
jgi:hypothetical protein